MLSLHGVRSIRAKSLDSTWIELTFEGYEESVTLCIYAWTGSEDAQWPNAFITGLKRAIETLPPTPPAAKLLEPFEDPKQEKHS